MEANASSEPRRAFNHVRQLLGGVGNRDRPRGGGHPGQLGGVREQTLQGVGQALGGQVVLADDLGGAGSSTCCELAIAGKPSILVPLKIALDDDQGQNARLLADAGAAEIISEDQLTPESLAGALQRLFGDPAELTRMAAAARSVAVPDAAEKLADLVERTARPS